MMDVVKRYYGCITNALGLLTHSPPALGALGEQFAASVPKPLWVKTLTLGWQELEGWGFRRSVGRYPHSKKAPPRGPESLFHGGRRHACANYAAQDR